MIGRGLIVANVTDAVKVLLKDYEAGLGLEEFLGPLYLGGVDLVTHLGHARLQ